jgi:Flp pilus assembly protein TadB
MDMIGCVLTLHGMTTSLDASTVDDRSPARASTSESDFAAPRSRVRPAERPAVSHRGRRDHDLVSAVVALAALFLLALVALVGVWLWMIAGVTGTLVIVLVAAALVVLARKGA